MMADTVLRELTVVSDVRLHWVKRTPNTEVYKTEKFAPTETVYVARWAADSSLVQSFALQRERTTKAMVVYSGEGQPITSLYVRKGAFKNGFPREIRVQLHPGVHSIRVIVKE